MTGERSEVSTMLRSVPWPFCVFAVAWLLLAAYWQWLVHVDGILGDMWGVLPGYQQLPEMDVVTLWRELTARYAQVHVLAIPKLFFWVNFAFFAGSGSFLKFCSFLLCLINLGLLLALVSKERLFQTNKAVVLVAGLIVFFNGFQTLVIDWDFLIQHYLAIFFSLSAFVVYARYRCIPAVFALTLMAGLSCGSGIASLISLGFLLLIRRESRYVLCAYLLFAGFCSFLIWPESLPAQPGLQKNAFFWSGPILLMDYLSYPFSAFGCFRLLGILLLLMVCHAFMRCLRTREFLLSDFLVCYFFLIACSVVVGRYRFIAEGADLSRFYVYIAPLWFFLLLKLAEYGRMLLCVAAFLLCSFLAVGGLAAVAVAADHAGRMEMARVVAVNGNFAHFAVLRLDALSAGESALKQQAGYLQRHQMDIYKQTVDLGSMPAEDFVCHLIQHHSASTSRGKFVDYFFSGRSDAGNGYIAMYAADENLSVRYHGVAVAAVNRMKGWISPLSEMRWQDWPLMVPLWRLPANNVLLYTHLPQHETPASFTWWLVSHDGRRCRVVIEPEGQAAN